MYKHCSTEEGARRQRQIEQCLLKLMSSVPYERITISDICQEIGLSRKSFYRYFSSKEGCLYALIDHSIMDFASTYLPDSAALSTELYEHYFRYWKQLHPLLDALCQNQLTNCLLERTVLCVTQEEHELRNYLMANGQDDGFEQLLFMICGITGILIHWYGSGYQKSAKQMAATVERLMGHSATPL